MNIFHMLLIYRPGAPGEAKNRTEKFQMCTFSYMVLIIAIEFLSLSQLRPTKIIRLLYPSRNVCVTSQLQEKQRRESLRSRLVDSLSVVFTAQYCAFRERLHDIITIVIPEQLK